VAQAQRNLANAKRLSEAVRRQANNALRGVWSEGPITYHGPVHHRTGWTKGAWADTTRRTLASRQAARNRLLGNETLNRYHHNHKGAMNATQNALKALTNGTRPLHPMEAGLLLEQLERVENKYRTTGRLFAWERALLKDKALVKGMAHLMTTNNRPPPPSNNLTPNNLPHLLPLLHAAHHQAKKGPPIPAPNNPRFPSNVGPPCQVVRPPPPPPAAAAACRAQQGQEGAAHAGPDHRRVPGKRGAPGECVRHPAYALGL